jgi:Tfp pilus assembly protein PilO
MRPQVKKIVLLSIVFSLVGIVILGASFYFLYVNGIEKNKEKLAQLQVVLEDYRLKAAQVPAKQEELRQVRLRAQKAQQQVPVFDENEFDRFLWQLRNMARSTGVQVKPPRASAGRSGTPDPGDIVRATYDLSVSGDFKRLWDFVKIVESSIRFVEIENYQFQKSKEGDRESTNLTMKVSVFAYRSPSAAKAEVKKPNEPEKFTELPPQ